MELFNLLAKLTLDKDEFDKGLDEAQRDADSFSPPEDQTLELDTSDYTSGLDDAEAESESFSDSVGSIFTNLKGVLVGLGIVGLVTGIVTQLKEGVELAKNHGDQIDKQSQKMGISAKAYQEWSYALNLSGASIDDLNRGLRTWQQAVGDEDAVGKLSAAFAALGIDAEEAFKKLEKGENLDALLDQVMYGLADKSAGDRGWIAEALFGKNATQLNALFNQTSKEIKNAREEAEDLGLIMTDEEVKNAAAYMDATTRLEGALNGIKEAFAGSILPLLTDATNRLAEFIGMLNPRSKKSTLSETLTKLDEDTAAASKKLDETSNTAQALIEKLSSMGDYWTLDEKGQKTWTALAQEFIDAYPQFADAIDLENKAIKGNTDEINANIRAWTEREKQRLIDQNTEQKREAIAKKYADALDREVEAEVKEAEASDKRAQALAEINKALERAGLETLGEGASTAEMRNAKTRLRYIAGEDVSEQQRINELGAVYLATMGEAEKLRAESNSMYAEADAATESLEIYQEKLAEKLGITQSDLVSATAEATNLKNALDSIPNEKRIRILEEYEDAHSHAIGSPYIPYDNYPALLHRGERVLTATEVRKGEGSGSPDYSAMEDRIVAAINKGMANATVRSYLNGKDITDDVNRRNMEGIKGRRFAT